MDNDLREGDADFVCLQQAVDFLVQAALSHKDIIFFRLYCKTKDDAAVFKSLNSFVKRIGQKQVRVLLANLRKSWSEDIP